MKRYWAGGFVNKNLTDADNARTLKKFIDGEYWQAIYYDLKDESAVAKRARNAFAQITIGDHFLIKGYGGTHDLVVHLVGEVVKKDNTAFRLDVKAKNIQLYRGKAPRGQGAGNWFNALLEVKRPDDIKMLF